MQWFLTEIVPTIPGRTWRRANTVFWPRSHDDFNPRVGHHTYGPSDNYSTDTHLAVPFRLLLALATVPLYMEIGGRIVSSHVIPQGGQTSTGEATLSAAYLRADRLVDRRLLDLPALARGPTTQQLLEDFTVIYADDASSYMPALRPQYDNGASASRAQLILDEL